MAITATQHIKLHNVAEKEIMKYAGDHVKWHQHIHNVSIDPLQALKCEEMDLYKNTVDFSSRRTRKTSIKELYQLKWNATHPYQELGITAPRLKQAQTNLKYHTDAINRSEILKSYILRERGRRQLADTYYKFANHSGASAYGIMSQVDGDDITAASLEEVDDMPAKRLGNFLLMMAATERMGASLSADNDPQIRITGVYKGADTLSEMITAKDETGKALYHVLGAYRGPRAIDEIKSFIDSGLLDPSLVDLNSYEYPVPIGNAPMGIELGLLNQEFIESMQNTLSPDEFARQLLCINSSSRNLIWDSWRQKAVQLGVKVGLEVCPPMPGGKYKKRGLLSFGYDHTGHGESPEASKSSLVVAEEMGGFFVPLWVKTWPAGTDDNIIRKDLISFWRYYMPDYAVGDAYGVGMLTSLNDDLYDQGLTTVNRRTLNSGQSSASHWPQWPFAPLQFEGMTKHAMAQGLRTLYSKGRVAHPYIGNIDLTDKDRKSDPDTDGLIIYNQQLTNIKIMNTSKAYSSYKMVKTSIGDDCFDAAMAASWALIARGGGSVKTVITSSSKTREQLLTANNSLGLLGIS
jgi:hypothetical protein